MEKYRIEVDFGANGSRVTYFPNFFQHPGDPIDACNWRIKKILENEEYGINKENLFSAKVYLDRFKKVLDVDYREKKMNLSFLDIEDFWIKS